MGNTSQPTASSSVGDTGEVRSDPVVLVVLDGWGEAPDQPGNAIARAGAAEMSALRGAGPTSLLAASGHAVGLPAGVMGNSEVGHLTIGAGRVVAQDLVRINEACADGTFTGIPELERAFAQVKSGSGRMHYFGLCSDAGVHSDLAHLRALVRTAAAAGVPSQHVHAFLDGRDTPPDSGRRYVSELADFLAEIPGAGIASLMGRYWAMDRDQRWERTERALRALVLGEGEQAQDPRAAMAGFHDAGVGDEFVEPTIVDPGGLLQDGDGVIFFNFRADRARQLTRALNEDGFVAFTAPRPKLSAYVCMTEYQEDFGLPVLFRRKRPEEGLGETLSSAGWPQLRLAETEKYAHVTYFVNGGREAPFPSEERSFVPSPRVATYDQTPAMSARPVTDLAVDWIARGGRRLLIVNYANADMVGHTGELGACIEACRVVDECLGRLLVAVNEVQGVLAVTADHGNAEVMIDDRGAPMTAHTTSPVPFALHDARAAGGRRTLRRSGGLSDVAPTVLSLAGVPVPAVMTGRSLLS